MWRRIVLVLVILVGASCAATVRWEKPGVTDADRRKDETECSSRASQEVKLPSAQTSGTTTNPPVDPQQTRISAYDQGVYEDCMKTRGYQPVPARPSN